MLDIHLRYRPGPGRIEIHRDACYTPSLVTLIVYSERRCETTVGLHRGAAVELCRALGDFLPELELLGPLTPSDFVPPREAEARAAGALGKNTETDSHPPQQAQRSAGGDCGISGAVLELPMVGGTCAGLLL